MKDIREWIDVIAKVILAIFAGVVGYYFSFQKQQNDDIKLIVDMATAEAPQKKILGASIAQEYLNQKRIPEDLYTAIFVYANNIEDKNLQAVVNSGAAQASKENIKVKQALIKASSTLPIRIYFHIRQESDRGLASKMEKMIESYTVPTGNSIIVPGVQLVVGAQSKSLLKCFKKEECNKLGTDLVKLFSENHVSVELSDQSDKYEKSTAIRPNHFEAWFAPGSLDVK